MKDGRRKTEDGKRERKKYFSSSVFRLPSFEFFGGKGGVGKTTCAAMAALAGSERTLLVTTDPASSLSGVFDAHVGVRPVSLRGAPGVCAARLDAARAFARWLEPRRPLLSAIGVRGTYLDDEDVARLLNLSLPGIDEIIGLLEVVRMARDGEEAASHFQRVIVDTAPTGHTLRLLAAPALLGRVAGVLDVLHSHHRAVVSALRGAYTADASDALIQELKRDSRALADLLRSPAATIAWVTLPEPMALEETADAISALERDGIQVARLIVNRLTPSGAADCEWCAARRRFEARALEPLLRRFPGRQIAVLPELEREPRGVRALREAASKLAPYSPPPSAPPVAHRVRAPLPADKGDSPLFSHIEGTASVFDARWLLFGGKGGVGKSTCAAAAALATSRDRRVLLVSTDPAHSLGDVFGTPLDDQPRTIPGAPPSLHVREIDAAAAFARFRHTYDAAIDESFEGLAHLIDLAPPGIDEVIAIAEVASALADERAAYELVITDTAPTGHALRLLHTPSILRDWTRALMMILRKYRNVSPPGTLGELLVRFSKQLRGLQDLLSNAARTHMVVVTRAAALPVEEAQDLIAALDALRVSVGAVVVNALGAGDCRRCGRISRTEAAQVAHLRRALRGGHRYAIIGTPAEIPPPHGVAALTSWAKAWRHLA